MGQNRDKSCILIGDKQVDFSVAAHPNILNLPWLPNPSLQKLTGDLLWGVFSAYVLYKEVEMLTG